MPVVINDFEVVVEQQRPAEGRPGAGSQQPQTAALTPIQLQEILRRQAERLARLRAT